jgi:hypothetical protein
MVLSGVLVGFVAAGAAAAVAVASVGSLRRGLDSLLAGRGKVARASHTNEGPAAAATSLSGPRPTTKHNGRVTYSCGGSAPHGIDIVYGPSGSSLSAGKLPFLAHGSIGDATQYFAISAQLRDGGTVTCTVSVVDEGKTAIAAATAEGGHNVASPEICADFAGEWQPCS